MQTTAPIALSRQADHLPLVVIVHTGKAGLSGL